MALRNCPNCGRVFTFLGKDLCPICLQEEEEKFDRVRLYLKENPETSIEELAEHTGVPVKNILKHLREGRLLMSPQKSQLTCEICGQPISTGRFCRRCTSQMASELRGVTASANRAGRFHIADHFKGKDPK